MKYKFEEKPKKKIKLLIVLLIFIVGVFIACNTSCHSKVKALNPHSELIRIDGELMTLELSERPSNTNLFIKIYINSNYNNYTSNLLIYDTNDSIYKVVFNNGRLELYNKSTQTTVDYHTLTLDNAYYITMMFDTNNGISLYDTTNDEQYFLIDEPTSSLIIMSAYINLDIKYADVNEGTLYPLSHFESLNTLNMWDGYSYFLGIDDYYSRGYIRGYDEGYDIGETNGLTMGNQNGFTSAIAFEYELLRNPENFPMMSEYMPEEYRPDVKKHTVINNSNFYYQLSFQAYSVSGLYNYDILTGQYIMPTQNYDNVEIHNERLIYFKDNCLYALGDTLIDEIEDRKVNDGFYIVINLRQEGNIQRYYYLDIYYAYMEGGVNAYSGPKAYYMPYFVSTFYDMHKVSILISQSTLVYDVFLTFNDSLNDWIETNYNSISVTRQQNGNYTLSTTISGGYLANNNSVRQAYEKGFNENFEEKGMTNWITSIFNTFSGFLSIKIGNVSIGSILLIPLAISICWFIIRMFRGGK